MRACALLLLVLVAQSCASRPPPPPVSGDLIAVVIRSAFADGVVPATVAGRVLLDSISFGRLVVLAGARPLEIAVTAQSGIVAHLVDPAAVLACPDREPCRIDGGGVYITLWDAAFDGDQLGITVTRTWNEERLYTMTSSATHQLTLARHGAGWRLAARQRLPS